MELSISSSSREDTKCGTVEDITSESNIITSTQSLNTIGDTNALIKPSYLTIPLKIRNEIYKYLLENPEFGNAGDELRNPRRYGLHPAILSVCRQTYDEGLSILYGQKFLMRCRNRYNPDEDEDKDMEEWITDLYLDTDSAITRYTNSYHGNDALEHVRHWKVLIDTRICSGIRRDTERLRRFCRAICLYPNVSLTFLICPQGVEKAWPSRGYHDLREFLRPLQLLRNVSNIEFRAAELGEIWGNYRHYEREALQPIAMPKDLEEEYLTLVKGNSPVQYVHLMYDSLLAYAQAFEQDTDFKQDMGLPKWESQVQWSRKGLKYNPFKYNIPFGAHPIEAHLDIASVAVYRDQMDNFKDCRRLLLQYLERYYQRIHTCSANLNQFIKSEKIAEGISPRGRRLTLFEPGVVVSVESDGAPSVCSASDSDSDHIVDEKVSSDSDSESTYSDDSDYVGSVRMGGENATEAVMLLEMYAAAFKRDLPYLSQLAVRHQKREFDMRWNELPREQILRKVDEAYGRDDHEKFVIAFKKAVTDMDKQYVEIRHARRDLFKWDVIGDTGSDIVVDSRELEPLDWDVAEPLAGPDVRYW